MKLRKYQEEGIRFLLEKEKAYIALDMGLGKTAIALHFLVRVNVPALIVAPKDVARITWPEEIHDWELESYFNYRVLHGPHKSVDFDNGVNLHIINYEGLKWLYNTLYKNYKHHNILPKYKALILDEASFVRNPKSDRFGYLCAIRDLFKYVVLLSGTPSPKSLLNLWSQYYLIDKGETLGKIFPHFRKQYFEQDPYRRYTWNPKPFAEGAIHRQITPRTFGLEQRRYISLPKRVFSKINVVLPASLQQRYKSFQKDFILSLEETQVKSLNKASLSSKLRQFVQGFIYENRDNGDRQTHFIHSYKVSALRQFIEDNPDENIICMIQYHAEVEMLKKEFGDVPCLTGLEKSNSVETIQQWNNKKIPLLIAHPSSLGYGLNLQAGGRTIVWFALTWNLEHYLQANKRLHRPGQKRTTRIFSIIAKDTIDERVLSVLNSRNATQQKLMQSIIKETELWMKTNGT